MTFLPQTDNDYPETVPNNELCREIEDEPLLCRHCQRTASNGIKCKGMCVADSDY